MSFEAEEGRRWISTRFFGFVHLFIFNRDFAELAFPMETTVSEYMCVSLSISSIFMPKLVPPFLENSFQRGNLCFSQVVSLYLLHVCTLAKL